MFVRKLFRRIGLKRVIMVQFEKSLADVGDDGSNEELSYVILDETNLPALIDQGLLPDGRYMTWVKKFSDDNYKKNKHDNYENCKEWLSRGDTCLVGLHRGRVIGWIWMCGQSEKYEPAIETNLQVDPRSCIIYRWLIYPPYRNRGFGTLLLKRTLYILNQQKCSKAVMVVENDNLPSMKATEKLGFEATQSIKRVRLFGYSKLSVNQIAFVSD